jgi:hypothetical protein
VDELMSVSPNPAVIPEYLRAIYTRGRELKVACWGLTQRPSGISQIPISEAIHYFVFDLNLKTDRKKLVEITGQPELMELPGDTEEYAFWYYNVKNKRPTLAKLKL